MSLIETHHDPFGWSRANLTPEDVRSGLLCARDPDKDVANGPVEAVLSLQVPDHAWALHQVLHAWRMGQGREQQARQARSLMCGRLLRACAWHTVRPHLLATMTALQPGERGPLSYYLEYHTGSGAAMDRQDLAILRRFMVEPKWSALTQHAGRHGVPEGWEVMGWLGSESLSHARGATFATPKVRQSAVEMFRTWVHRGDDEACLVQASQLASHLVGQWQAMIETGTDKVPDRELALATAWVFGLDLLGRDLAHAMEQIPHIVLATPAWAVGFDLVRQACAKTARLTQACETVLSVPASTVDRAKSDSFLWRSLPMPSMILSNEPALGIRVEEQWASLMERHPAWVVETPLPPQLLTAMGKHPRLQALWREAMAQSSTHLAEDAVVRQRPRLRA